MGSYHKGSIKTKWLCWPPQTKTNFLVLQSLALLSKSPFSHVSELCSHHALFTCELFLAAVSHTGFQVLQLDLDLLVVPQGLLTLSPNRDKQKEEQWIKQAGRERMSNVSFILD